DVRQVSPVSTSQVDAPGWTSDSRRVISTQLVSLLSSDLAGSSTAFATLVASAPSFALRPDDGAIAFARYDVCCNGDGGLWIAQLPSGVPARITATVSGATDYWPSWRAK